MDKKWERYKAKYKKYVELKPVTGFVFNLFNILGQIYTVGRMVIGQFGSNEAIINELETARYFTDEALKEKEITEEEYDKILELIDRLENEVRRATPLRLIGFVLGDLENYLKDLIEEKISMMAKYDIAKKYLIINRDDVIVGIGGIATAIGIMYLIRRVKYG